MDVTPTPDTASSPPAAIKALVLTATDPTAPIAATPTIPLAEPSSAKGLEDMGEKPSML
jgi:hypothetical protein